MNEQDLTEMSDCNFNAKSKSLFAQAFTLVGQTTFAKREKSDKVVSVRVYSINLSKVLDASRSERVAIKKRLGLRRFRDLIHAMCALYDNSLPDIGPSSVYECISAAKSYTIFVIKSEKEEEEEEEKKKKETVCSCTLKLGLTFDLNQINSFLELLEFQLAHKV